MIAQALYERFPDEREGHLSRVRALVVSRKSCAEVARALDLGTILRERTEIDPDISERGNVLAALVESVIAALYLEYGLETIREAVVQAFDRQIRAADRMPVDDKTRLQEALAQTKQRVAYAVLEVAGPAHDREFTCVAMIDGEQFGIGRGRTKKDAEQEAARQALRAIA